MNGTMNQGWHPPATGVVRGCWQLSRGHGPGWSRGLAFAALDSAASIPGPLHLDCADIYTGVEELLGDWMASRREAAGEVVVHTKCVPDLAALPRIDRAHVRRIVLRSRGRLRRDVLDLVQLHWWDFGVPGWVRAAEWLAELREEGVVRHVGVTNFGADALRTLLDEGIPIVTNQVQFSLLDRRPLGGLTDLCAERGVALLCYGALAGGLLADGSFAGGAPGSPLVGAPPDSPPVGAPPDGPLVGAPPDSPPVGDAPDSPLVGDAPGSPPVGAAPDGPPVGASSGSPPSRTAPTTGMPESAVGADSRSITKYRLILDDVGGPAVLRRARAALARIAARQDASLADVAASWTLAQPSVGAVVIGLSRRRLTADPRTVRLRPEDLAALQAAVPATVPGAVYEAERDRSGPHGRIMRYDLNREG